MKESKISFFLMNEKGYRVLLELIRNEKKIAEVVCSKDKNLVNDYYKEIKELCENNDISFFDRNDNFDDQITADYIITIGWRWLIKGQLQDKLIVSHDSILPKYRGFAPLVNMLINGENEIGVTFLFASDEYDCGNIITQKIRKINYPIKINKAIEIISELFFDSIMEIYSIIERGETLPSNLQNESKATYSLWRNENDYLIDFQKSSKEIKRFIDAVGEPYLGASAFIKNRKVRILDVETLDDKVIENRDVGKVIFMKDGKPVIVCGEGLLKINELINDDDRTSILPLDSFRIKFKGKEE
jgi:methionyl-tRNA formyltransferase